MTNKNEFAGETIFAGDQLFIFPNHRISALFPRQADISAKTFFRAGAFVACLHDATASSGDDHESRLGYFPAKLNSLLILDPGGLRAGGTKNCYLAELRV